MTGFRIAATCSTPDIVLAACAAALCWMSLFDVLLGDWTSSGPIRLSLSGELGNSMKQPSNPGRSCSIYLLAGIPLSIIFHRFDTAHVVLPGATSTPPGRHPSSRHRLCAKVYPGLERAVGFGISPQQCHAMSSYDLNLSKLIYTLIYKLIYRLIYKLIHKLIENLFRN